jgi:short subunit dehydrogenase-like uncharacterized protein
MHDFDLIVFGATGYTGRLVVEALLEFPEPGLKVAMAGRNLVKLESVRREIAKRFPAASELALIQADSHDEASLSAMVQRTRVLCTTVGPYAELGDSLVKACVEYGVDYCDLTGEVYWMRKNIDAYHEEAKAKGLRIVHAAGFDSIPFDIGVVALQQAALTRWGAPATEVRTATGKMVGGFSGGTVASMALLFDSIRRDRSILRLMGNPYALVPGGTGPDKNDSQAVCFSPDHNTWTAPFIMAGCNTRVVRRSHALQGYPWGEDFSYTEVMGTGRGLKGWLRAQSMRLVLGALVTTLAIRWLRGLVVGRVLPSPGDGPSEAARARGCFNGHVVGRRGEDIIRLDVSLEGDPGYLATSRMLAQTAVALAVDELPQIHGVLTPGAFMGTSLLRRLPTVGIRFDVRDEASRTIDS